MSADQLSNEMLECMSKDGPSLYVRAMASELISLRKRVDQERINTAHAIEGALNFGFEGFDPPPEDEPQSHWLKSWWETGRMHAEKCSEVDRLTRAIQTEADYCLKFAEEYKGTERGDRHQERADRLLSCITEPACSITADQFSKEELRGMAERAPVKQFQPNAIDCAVCSCCTCGYKWLRGQNGSHSCSTYLQIEIDRLHTENSYFRLVNGQITLPLAPVIQTK